MIRRLTRAAILPLMLATALFGDHAGAEIRGYENLSITAHADADGVPDEFAEYLDSTFRDDNGHYNILLRKVIAIGDPIIVETETSIWRYQTKEEINSDGDTRVYVDSVAEKLNIDLAMVVRPDGEVVYLDPETVQVVDDQRDQIFSDEKVVVILWPALEPGATVIFQRTRETDTSKLPVPWSRVIYPRTTIHSENFELSATWRDASAVPAWTSGDAEFNCRTSGKQRLTCNARQLAPAPLDESVNYYDELPHVAIGAKIEWSDLNRIVGQYVRDAMSSSEKIESKAAELAGELPGEFEKLQAIHEFVARDIRYVGLEDGRFSHVPRDSEQTLDRRYGDCKGKTVLLIDLLRAVGIQASPVLVATRREDPDVLQLPAAGFFDHMIACGQLSTGMTFCSDPTDEYSAVQYLAGSTQGAVSLNLDKDEQPGALPAAEFRWTMTESLELNVLADGTLDETLSIDYEGPYGAWLRSRLSGKTVEERAEWAVEDYQEVIRTKVTPEISFDGIDDLSDRLNVTSRSVYESLLSPDENIRYEENPGWLDQLLGFFDTQNDHYDYRFPGLRYEGTVTVRLDEHWQMDRPGATLDFDSEFGSLRRRYRVADGTMLIETVVELPQRVMTVEEQKSFNRFVETIKQNNAFRWYAVLATDEPVNLMDKAKEWIGIY